MGEIGAGQDLWEEPEAEGKGMARIGEIRIRQRRGEISQKLDRCRDLPNGVPRDRPGPLSLGASDPTGRIWA